MMVFDKPDMPVPAGLSLIATTFCIPLSMPLSILLFWRSYRRGRFRPARLASLLPLIPFLASYIIDRLVEGG